jgi:hypothetical protein
LFSIFLNPYDTFDDDFWRRLQEKIIFDMMTFRPGERGWGHPKFIFLTNSQTKKGRLIILIYNLWVSHLERPSKIYNMVFKLGMVGVLRSRKIFIFSKKAQI